MTHVRDVSGLEDGLSVDRGIGRGSERQCVQDGGRAAYKTHITAFWCEGRGALPDACALFVS